MRNRLDPHQQILKEYDEAFEAYMAFLPKGCVQVDGPRVSLKVINTKAIAAAEQRLAQAERELEGLDAA
jgi:hypothetical protein